MYYFEERGIRNWTLHNHIIAICLIQYDRTVENRSLVYIINPAQDLIAQNCVVGEISLYTKPSVYFLRTNEYRHCW